MDQQEQKGKLPRNVKIVAITSFLTDISSEMVINTLPLFLSNVLGVKTYLIGLIEGVAESTSSLLKMYSGWLSDRLGRRKSLAVLGYAISALSKPLFYFAAGWGTIAAARWGDRVGKGIRTAPRDALLADSITADRRGHAFGFHRAADTAGAFCGLLIALGLTWLWQRGGAEIVADTFRAIVLASLLPAFLAVLVLAFGVKETKVPAAVTLPRFGFKSLGREFRYFIIMVGLFEMGNSSDAFIVLRAQERGLSVVGILAMLLAFNFVYTVISTPAGKLSDRIGRRRVLLLGWTIYALTYLGLALAGSTTHIVLLFIVYGAYYGLSFGTGKALVADLVPAEKRGLAYGTYNAVLGLADLPASLLAGLLWSIFGPASPFYFGTLMAGLAIIMLFFWKPAGQAIEAGPRT